jgi:hypothetical protein
MTASVFLPSLRIDSRTRDPAEIAAALGAPCTGEGRIGELMSPRNPRSQRHMNNFCLFESPLPEDRSLSEHIIALAGLLDAPNCDQTVLMDCEMMLRFGVEHGHQGGVTITRDAAASASAHSLDIVLDLYFEDSDTE